MNWPRQREVRTEQGIPGGGKGTQDKKPGCVRGIMSHSAGLEHRLKRNRGSWIWNSIGIIIKITNVYSPG